MTADDYGNLVSERALDAACGAVGLDLSSAGAKRYRNALEAAAPIMFAEWLEEIGQGMIEQAKGLLDE